MRISELAAASGTSVATLKFYLREQLLPAGEATSRTRADYGDQHVQRVRLIRALTEVGGLSLARVKRVLTAMETPGLGRTDLLAVSQRALDADADAGGPGGEDCGAEPDGSESSSRAWKWLQARGWRIAPNDPFIARLDRAWAACDDAGVGLSSERLDAYADAVERIGTIDVASVPAEPDAAVRQVIVGTVLVDAVLQILRRLAQQHVASGGQGVSAPRH